METNKKNLGKINIQRCSVTLIQRIADLSNILAQIVDFVCNLARKLDCESTSFKSF